MQVTAAELVAKAGEVDRLSADLQAAQQESQTLRSDIAQLNKHAELTQRKLDSEVRPSSCCAPVKVVPQEVLAVMHSEIVPRFSLPLGLICCAAFGHDLRCQGLQAQGC